MEAMKTKEEEEEEARKRAKKPKEEVHAPPEILGQQPITQSIQTTEKTKGPARKEEGVMIESRQIAEEKIQLEKGEISPQYVAKEEQHVGVKITEQDVEKLKEIQKDVEEEQKKIAEELQRIEKRQKVGKLLGEEISRAEAIKKLEERKKKLEEKKKMLAALGKSLAFEKKGERSPALSKSLKDALDAYMKQFKGKK